MNKLPADLARTLHKAEHKQEFILHDKNLGELKCKLLRTSLGFYLLSKLRLPESIHFNDISQSNLCYPDMLDGAYPFTVYIPSDPLDAKIANLFKNIIAFQPLQTTNSSENTENTKKNLKLKLYKDLSKLPDNTRVLLKHIDHTIYSAVIARRQGIYVIMTDRLIASSPPGQFDRAIVDTMSNENRVNYVSSIALSDFNLHLQKLLEDIVEIKILKKDTEDMSKDKLPGEIEVRKIETSLETIYNYLHELPHGTKVRIKDRNGVWCSGIVYSTPFVHAILTNARASNSYQSDDLTKALQEHGYDKYIGLGCFLESVLRSHLEYIDTIFIPILERSKEMDPKELNNKIEDGSKIASPGVKQMSKLVVKDIALKDISEASLKRHIGKIADHLGYKVDPNNSSVMWKIADEIDLSATPTNITPSGVKEIILQAIKENPAEDSGWMSFLRQYNLIASVTLVEKNAKG